MHKAPSVQRPREIFDSHGHLLGRSQGFRPDPGAGSLGLELELSPEVVDSLGSSVRSVWVKADQVMAVRRDRMTLDLSLAEIGRLVRRPARALDIEQPTTRDPLEA